MKKVLLHCCCAPCSVSCIPPLCEEEDIALTAFWYNPNIHPFKEYEARRNCLIDYTASRNVPLIVAEDYGLREFVTHTVDDLDHRCRYCYTARLEKTAAYAAENGFDAFTSTLFASVYQDHELLKKLAEELARQYKTTFLYRDFRPNFRKGNTDAREMGFYMQKYCGCIFSEEERYQKQITRDKLKFADNG